ncbi:hypothetical protein B0T24DRAFT_679709 [Lasiosphaeria ovina]|uniref:TcdA/TcdB toxin pore forming domain-containing protein n=1 Tax=Lasiosphaeria ovina TaxID=92902 RepID=A0AAE0N849_9PEZI|nr:hypothetical protein B0T24DRAFT_679709 [Lasiosphaeria ovina]
MATIADLVSSLEESKRLRDKWMQILNNIKEKQERSRYEVPFINVEEPSEPPRWIHTSDPELKRLRDHLDG